MAMANHLDLEEQEQLDQIKHFWNQHGNLITWIITAVLAAYAFWGGYQYWANSQSSQAATLFDEMEKAATAKNSERIAIAFADLSSKFSGTTYAAQAGLLHAASRVEASDWDEAGKALDWVVKNTKDEGFLAIAALRLAGVQLQQARFDDALKALDRPFPEAFAGLVSDRKADILAAKKSPIEARAAYDLALQKLPSDTDYRRLVEIKRHADMPAMVVPVADGTAASSTK
jgi:predicted negative regulator of RcsB-dependent stress response